MIVGFLVALYYLGLNVGTYPHRHVQIVEPERTAREHGSRQDHESINSGRETRSVRQSERLLPGRG